MPRTNPIDRAHKLLAILGWSFGDMLVGDVWQVFAQRDDDWGKKKGHHWKEKGTSLGKKKGHHWGKKKGHH
jgi:hypothetical protein